MVDDRECCGCTACASACPHKAIIMEKDSLGFYYPKTIKEKCTECGLCDKVCQFKEDYLRYHEFLTPMSYACRLFDKEELLKCQSGGASYAIIRTFLEETGAVYGVAFDECFNAVHKRATTLLECEQFRGSKYIQSFIGDTYQQIKFDLKNGNRVLFIGTGCQVSGLKAFLPKRLQNNLVTVDIICHGVSSPQVWQDHLYDIRKKYNDDINSVVFRDKRYGWRSRKETISLKGKDKDIIPYTFNLLTDLSVRPSCGICKFTNTERVADVTIGDCWGWENISDKWHDNKGVSLILVNTKKGLELIEKTTLLEKIQISIEDCLQPQLQHPLTYTQNNIQFAIDYSKKGYKYIAKKYSDQGIKYKILKFKQFIHKLIR